LTGVISISYSSYYLVGIGRRYLFSDISSIFLLEIIYSASADDVVLGGDSFLLFY
jgi:hypothetical protein